MGRPKWMMRGPERGGVWLRDTITDAHGRGWAIEAWVVLRTGRPVVGEIRVFPLKPTGRELGQPWNGQATDVPRRGLERRLLRDVPIGRYGHVVASEISRARQTMQGWKMSTPQRKIEAWFTNYMFPGAMALPERPRPRRDSGRDDRFYAELADAYVKRLAAQSASPVKDIARKRGEEPAHIRDLLHEARVRGLLSQGTPGKREGDLLPRAYNLLGVAPRARRKGGRQ